MQIELPQGGPLNLSPDIAALFLAQIEVMAAAGIGDEKRRDLAARKRDQITRRMDDRQRELVGLVGEVVPKLVKS